MSKWWGDPWGAPVNRPSEKTITPVGEKCEDCGQEIEQGQNGHTMLGLTKEGDTTMVHYHHWCFMLSVVGPDLLLSAFWTRGGEAFNAAEVEYWKQTPCGCRIDQGGGIEFCDSHKWWEEHQGEHIHDKEKE